jgi:transcriptional regulator with GAF, ATPase, and Fis domain
LTGIRVAFGAMSAIRNAACTGRRWLVEPISESPETSMTYPAVNGFVASRVPSFVALVPRDAGGEPELPLPAPGRALRAVLDMVERVAATDATVLVWGESGVGKERVARMLHARSPRAQGPLVTVNCAALPLELLESELFGYERGAFTGAHQSKPGKFELANGGTILLDEIGELPLALQAKLLSVLQDGRFSRLGSRRDLRVDVRVVALTNRNLAQLVMLGQFREDLYYRLNVVAIHVPPLRERREEIPGIVEYYLDFYASQYDRPRPELSASTWRRLMTHEWPGNVRELENLVKRIVVLGTDEGLARELETRPSLRVQDRTGVHAAPDLPAAPDGMPEDTTGETTGLKDIVRQAGRRVEREALERTLNQVRWNRGEAARRLKISYTALLYKIKQHGLER